MIFTIFPLHLAIENLQNHFIFWRDSAPQSGAYFMNTLLLSVPYCFPRGELDVDLICKCGAGLEGLGVLFEWC